MVVFQFLYLLLAPLGIACSAVQWNICAITAGVITTKLNTIKVFISKASIDFDINHEKFVSENKVKRI